MYKTREAGIILKQSLEKMNKLYAKNVQWLEWRWKQNDIICHFLTEIIWTVPNVSVNFFRNEAKIMVILLNKYGGLLCKFNFTFWVFLIERPC